MAGVIVAPVDAVASPPAAYRPGKPDFFMAGMVIGPVVSTLETAEPDIMPIRPDETTETFACPPRKRPNIARATLKKNEAAPVCWSATPKSKKPIRIDPAV